MNNEEEKIELPLHKIYEVVVDIGDFTMYVAAESEKAAKQIAQKEDIRDYIDPEYAVSLLKANSRVEYSWINDFPVNFNSNCLLKVGEYMSILKELDRRHQVWLENDKKQLKLDI